MHLALFTDGIFPFHLGGMQKHSFHLSKYLAASGIRATVFYVQSSQDIDFGEYYTSEELIYLQFIAIPFPKRFPFPGHYIYESYLYSKAIVQQFETLQLRPDVIYVQGFSGWYWLSHRKKQKDPFTVINFHGLEMFQQSPDFKTFFQLRMLRPFVKWNIAKADVTVSLGGKLTPLVKRFNKQVIKIPNGIEKEWLCGQPAQPGAIRKFAFVGRFEPRKGIKELQQVILQLPENGNYQFEFIGPIPEENRIVHPNVRYHGAIHDEKIIRALLQSSDVLVCPSWSEGMPIVILEAMASGCAVIATDVGAVAELVSEENGWLLPQVTLSGLKTALLEAMQCDSESLLLKKQRSLEKIKAHFLWEKVIQLHIEKFNLLKVEEAQQ